MTTANPVSLAALRKSWAKDPDFVREFDALADEFALVAKNSKDSKKSGHRQEASLPK